MISISTEIWILLNISIILIISLFKQSLFLLFTILNSPYEHEDEASLKAIDY